MGQRVNSVASVTMDAIVLCPSCEHQNAFDVQFCVVCRTPLARGRHVTNEKADDLYMKRRAEAGRRRIVRWALVALVLLGVGGWTGYRTLGGPGPPVSDISASPAPGDWPMYRRGPSHSAFVSEGVPIPEGRVRWRFETKAPFLSSPAVVQGTVYLSTGDGRVVALEAETGGLIWEHEVTGPVNSSPAVAGDLVLVGLRDGRLLALDRADGKTRWEFFTGNPIYSSPSVYRGVAYLGSSDARLYALDAVTGKKRWSYLTGGTVQASAAVNEDVVAVTSLDRHLYILDANTGKHRLDLVMSSTGLSPALDEELAYVADTRGLLMAIDWKKQQLPFEKTARWVRLQLLAWGLVGSIPPQKGVVWSFWRPGESFVGPPVVGAGMVYVAAASGAVYALDRSDGHLVWGFVADAKITGSPSIAGQTLYVGDAEGGLYGIDILTGETTWRFWAADSVTSTAVPANGMLYVATASGTLYAIR